jgi:oligopeptide transport system substrate-binding protein
MKKLLLAALAPCLIILFTAAQAETVLRRGNLAEPGTLDPQAAVSTTQYWIGIDLYEGLSALAPDGKAVPGEAASWTVSADGKVWTFSLRDGIEWSNGDPITAEDFVYSFRRLVDPANASELADEVEPILNARRIVKGEEKDLTKLGVAAPDPHTVQVTLMRPTPALPEILALMLPVHRASVEKLGREAFQPGKMVSNGAYRLVEWQPQARVAVERNPKYWDRNHVAIDRVEFYGIEDHAEELKRYRAGDLDITASVPVDQLEFVRQTLGAELKQSPGFGIYAIGFNEAAAPFKDNPKLREALTLAIDRSALTDKVMHGAYAPAFGWVPNVIDGYHNPKFPNAELSQAEREALARKLYAEAGFSREHPAKFELLYETSDENRRIMIGIVGMWNRVLGVSVELNNMEAKVFYQRLADHQTQASHSGLIGAYVAPEQILEWFETGREINDTGYANPSFDALMRQARDIANPAERLKLMADAEAMALADFPAAPVFYRNGKHLVKPYIAGWQSSPCDTFRSKDLSILPH